MKLEETDKTYKYNATVKKVTDGDTLVVDLSLGFDLWMRDVKIRLYGIDAPESRTRDKEEKVKGMATKKRLKELVANKEIVVETKYGDETGKFGRILGIIHNIDGVNVNKQLVKEKLAKNYYGGKR
jgi:micrococcal nuclease